MKKTIADRSLAGALTASFLAFPVSLFQHASAAPLSFDCFDRRTGDLIIKSAMDVSNDRLDCEYAGAAAAYHPPRPEAYPIYQPTPSGVSSRAHRRVSENSAAAGFVGGMMGGILGGAIGGSLRK